MTQATQSQILRLVGSMALCVAKERACCSNLDARGAIREFSAQPAERKPINVRIRDLLKLITLYLHAYPLGQTGKLSVLKPIQSLSQSCPNPGTCLLLAIGGGASLDPLPKDPERDIHLRDAAVGSPENVTLVSCNMTMSDTTARTKSSFSTL